MCQIHEPLSGTFSEEAFNADALCRMEGVLIILEGFGQEVAQEFTHFSAVGVGVLGVYFEGEGGGEELLVEGFIKLADAHTCGDGPIGILGLYGLNKELLRVQEELGFFFKFLSHDMDGAAVAEGGVGEAEEGDFCEEEFCFGPSVLRQFISWGGGAIGDGFQEGLGFVAFALFQQADGIFGFGAQLPVVVGVMAFSDGLEEGRGLFELAAFKIAKGEGEAGFQSELIAIGVSDGFEVFFDFIPALQFCPKGAGLKAVGDELRRVLLAGLGEEGSGLEEVTVLEGELGGGGGTRVKEGVFAGGRSASEGEASSASEEQVFIHEGGCFRSIWEMCHRRSSSEEPLGRRGMVLRGILGQRAWSFWRERASSEACCS